MTNILGPHLGGRWTDKLELLRAWQPPFVLVLQPEVDKVAQLREACPQAIITGRFYHEDSHYASNISARPTEFAREIHQEIANNPATPLLDYVQSNNEVCQDWQGIQKLNQYTQAWMALADQSQAYKCAILAFSVGNPDMPHKPGDPAGFDGRMLYWQQVLPSLNYAQRNNHILLLHAYGYPNMFAPDADWYIYRYERQVQTRLRTMGITDLKYAYGEIGIDRLIVNGKGGFKAVTNDQDYVNQLLQWEQDQQDQSLLLGGAIFTFGDSGGWDTYDIASTNAASLIVAHYADHANEYASLPIQGDNAVTETFLPSVGTGSSPEIPDNSLPARDISDDFKRRVPTITLIEPSPKHRTYRLIRAEYVPNGAQRFGPDHHILVDVLDASGKRQMGTPVNFHWGSDMKIVAVNKVSEPYGADYGMTSHGHSFGVWVGNFRELSDDVFGMGLGTIEQIDWNHHVTYYLVFQEVPPQAAMPPFTADPITTRFLRGDILRTTTTVNARRSPGTQGKATDDVIRQLAPNSAVELLEGPRHADGLTWWRTDAGWLAEVAPSGIALLTNKVDVPIAAPPIATNGIINPILAEAVLQVESGKNAYASDGRLVIRLELHLFRKYLDDNALFDAYFYHEPSQGHLDQRWRRSPNKAWQPSHLGSHDFDANQAKEWEVFGFAAKFNREAALLSLSMGAAQIMGFNHARIGYPSAEAMFNAFQRSEAAQIVAFFNYCISDLALFSALQKGDWAEIARRYNGQSSQVDTYVALMKDAYQQLLGA